MRAYVVDAFTDVPFAGNPAGVVLLDDAADAAWMQQVAAELRHSETAFLRARADGAFDLRWFTPTTEVDLCGHATLASAQVLALTGASAPYVFHTRTGELRAELTPDGAIEMEFPSQPSTPIDPPKELAAALGLTGVSVESNGIDMLVEVQRAADVRSVRPDLARLRRIECRGVIVTARADEDADYDFVSRFFAPRVGVDEDPVTGSAHCLLAPYWAGRIGRADLTGVQLSQRGGRIDVEVRGERVVLRGRAVVVVEGSLLAS